MARLVVRFAAILLILLPILVLQVVILYLESYGWKLHLTTVMRHKWKNVMTVSGERTLWKVWILNFLDKRLLLGIILRFRLSSTHLCKISTHCLSTFFFSLADIRGTNVINSVVSEHFF